jgi:hypothetical protein
VSDALLASYQFFAWFRRGAAGAISTVDPLQGSLPDVRAKIQAGVTVDATLGGAAVQTLTPKIDSYLFGPGDVVGIDLRHIVKTEPRHLTANFESNYFCGIDFDDPDLPWLFTPAKPTADDRLRPWLCLVALTGTEFKASTEAPNPLPVITVSDPSVLPNLNDSWAWAHVQVSGQLPQGGLASLVTDNPGAIISRLICSRMLLPDTAYTAFLVPAFEAGRLAGIGAAPPAVAPTTLDLAWSAATTGELQLPVYSQFEFHTSAQGDFESLVRQLKPREMPDTVGVRPIEVDQPGWNLPSAGPPILLGGALQTPKVRPEDWQDPDRSNFQQGIRTLINKTYPPVVDLANPGPDPTIVPPLYGRWHAAVKSADPAGPEWINDLNLDPRRRADAGLGTQVVQTQRVQLMAAAWKQVEGIEKANHTLRLAQTARDTLVQVFKKHFETSDDGPLLALTSAVHSRLRASPLTIAATIAQSRLPSRALSGAFRRTARARGPLQRRHGGPVVPGAVVTKLASGDISPAPPVRPPGGMVSLDDVSQQLDPSWMPGWLRSLAPYLGWLLLLVGLVLAVIAFVFVAGSAGVAAGIAVAVAILVVVAVLWAVLAPFLKKATVAQQVRFTNLNPSFFASGTAAPGFQLQVAGTKTPDPTATGNAAADATAFTAAATRLSGFVAAPAPEPEPPAILAISNVRLTLMQRLDPESTVVIRSSVVVTVDRNMLEWNPPDPLHEIMVAPEFPQPMYVPLRNLGQEYLLPGLADIPPDTMTLLRADHAFIEAYMVGLNHEMARQLLWHEYPTDQRGSYFRQFWDVSAYLLPPTSGIDDSALVEAMKDIPPIHQWPPTNRLGANENIGPEPIVPNNLVLLIRGELLRRYPTAVIYACQARWKDSARELSDQEMHPLFRGTLSPDITFFGFNLDRETAMGSDTPADNKPGWFFVIQQQVSEPRFGLEPAGDPYQPPTVKEWNDLSWANFAATKAALDKLAFAPAAIQPSNLALANQVVDGVIVNPGDITMNWGKDAAQTAFIALRRPVRIAIHASLMLKDFSTGA